MANRGIYQGNYEVRYSQEADRKGETKPVTSTFRKIEMTGCPCALLCFRKKKDTAPAQIIPWHRVIGICQKEEPAKEVKSAPKAKDKAKDKAKAQTKDKKEATEAESQSK